MKRLRTIWRALALSLCLLAASTTARCQTTSAPAPGGSSDSTGSSTPSGNATHTNAAPTPGSSPQTNPFSSLRGGFPARAIDNSVHQSGSQPASSVAEPPASDFQTGDVVPDVQKGLGPKTGAPVNAAPFKQGLKPRYTKPPSLSPEDARTRSELEQIIDQATKSSGAIFRDPENLIVKPPMLTALITLQKERSPYDLDASSSTGITLRDALGTGLSSNLDIKITQQVSLEKKWNMVGAFSGFLPDLSNEINFEGLHGFYVTPAGFAIPIHNPFLTTNNGFNWTLFKGGGILHNYRQTKHEYRASQAAVKGTVSEVLNDVTQNYYNLVLNEVLLQIRVKAVQTANALLLVNQDMFADGVNTQLDVLQAQYELSTNRQNLIQQQVSRREAAIKLATSINLNPEVDLSPANRLVSKIQLVDPRLSVADLLKIAIDNRPELKRYDELRLAAKEQLKVAKSTLFPVISGQGSIIGSGSRATSISNVLNNGGVGLSAAGAGVGPASVATLPLSGVSTGPKSWTMRSLFVLGVDAQWNLGGLGLKEISQIESARADARKATLEFNRALAGVYQQVRDAYLSSMSAENMIIETTDTVNYGTEQLRVAEVRLKDGIGTSLDVVNAEKNYINALVAKANAIVQYDVSQAKLVAAIGRASLDTLTSNVPLRQ